MRLVAKSNFGVIRSEGPNVPMKVYVRNDSDRNVAIRYRTMSTAGCSAWNTVRLGRGENRTIAEPFQFGVLVPARTRRLPVSRPHGQRCATSSRVLRCDLTDARVDPLPSRGDPQWRCARRERGLDVMGARASREPQAAIELSGGWIDAYAERVRERPRWLPPGDGEVERLEPPPLPHEFQEEALRALAAARARSARHATSSGRVTLTFAGTPASLMRS